MEKRGTTENVSRPPWRPAGERGFSLVELLIAMVVGLVVLGAAYSVFTLQNKTFGNQEEIVAMQQNIRAGMDMMAREIGMAGYDPASVNCFNCSPPIYSFFGATVDASQLQIKADLDGNGSIDANSQENAIYAFDAANYRITRNIGGGAQAFVENVQSFTFEYLDGNGNATAISRDVRRIRITITGRTAKPDPAYTLNGGYRMFALTAVIAPRNLAYVN